MSAGKIAVENMSVKFRECLKQINPGMLGPDKTRLEVAVLDETDPDAKKVKIEIQIVPSDSLSRSNDVTYRDTITCTQIAHEVGHLLGLVDEYTESKSANSSTGQLYDCRNRATLPSLMSDEEEKFFESNRSVDLTVRACVDKKLKDVLKDSHTENIACGLDMGETTHEATFITTTDGKAAETKEMEDDLKSIFINRILKPKGFPNPRLISR